MNAIEHWTLHFESKFNFEHSLGFGTKRQIHFVCVCVCARLNAKEMQNINMWIFQSDKKRNTKQGVYK